MRDAELMSEHFWVQPKNKTYKRYARSKEKDSNQQIFKLFEDELPQRFPCRQSGGLKQSRKLVGSTVAVSGPLTYLLLLVALCRPIHRGDAQTEKQKGKIRYLQSVLYF